MDARSCGEVGAVAKAQDQPRASRDTANCCGGRNEASSRGAEPPPGGQTNTLCSPGAARRVRALSWPSHPAGVWQAALRAAHSRSGGQPEARKKDRKTAAPVLPLTRWRSDGRPYQQKNWSFFHIRAQSSDTVYKTTGVFGPTGIPIGRPRFKAGGCLVGLLAKPNQRTDGRQPIEMQTSGYDSRLGSHR